MGNITDSSGVVITDSAAANIYDDLGPPAASYEDTVLADNPVGYWPADEAAFPLVDLSTGGNNFTAADSGGAYAVGQTPAPPMNSLSIYANDAWVGNGALASPTARPWTMEAWFYPTTTAQGGAIMHRGPLGGANGMSLGVGNGTMDSDGLEVIVLLDNVAWAPSGYTLPNGTNVWYHIVATDDSTNIKFYVNGSLVSTVSTVAPNLSTAGIYSSTEQTSGRYIIGNTAQLAIYATALSAGRIAAHWAARVPGLELEVGTRTLTGVDITVQADVFLEVGTITRTGVDVTVQQDVFLEVGVRTVTGVNITIPQPVVLEVGVITRTGVNITLQQPVNLQVGVITRTGVDITIETADVYPDVPNEASRPQLLASYVSGVDLSGSVRYTVMPETLNRGVASLLATTGRAVELVHEYPAEP